MARRRLTQAERWAQKQASRTREVRVTVRLTVSQAMWLEAWARRCHMSRSEAIRDALWGRQWKWEQVWERNHRAGMRQLIKRAEEWAPIDELLAEAREWGEEQVLAAYGDGGQSAGEH